eukprot:TRINITY_DN6163_c1_g1_i5.p1 TRINITY_DN6163_c1_g1~~TRINITY_DN6163_c1_g1_i5.p1  ORF type:complete len:383 (+),score=56.24 TRINITY_DN6163_c1_g1_i5:67-1215(+)
MSSNVDADPLLTTETQQPRRSKFLCPALVITGLTCLTLAIVFSFISFQASFYQEGVPIRVLALNTWGMPYNIFGGLDKEIRMPAIAQMIQKKEFDVYFLEELWMRPDHEKIRQKASAVGYHMTSYDSMTQRECPYLPLDFLCCDGSATPSGCSGLAVVSRYPMKEVQFTIYNDHGPMAGGEKMARKGFGRVRVSPSENITVDLFVTHTCASDLVEDKATRESQVKQLLTAVRESTADFAILGGDFNSDPRAVNETTYGLLKNQMASSMEDFFQRIANWLIPDRATYGNPRNTYSYTYDPVLYDYIWHRSNDNNLVLTNLFDIPWLRTHKDGGLHHTDEKDRENSSAEKIREKRSADAKMISLSDHEAVTASLVLYKKKKQNS